MKTFNSVDEYIANIDDGRRLPLVELRSIVRKEVRGVRETISYGMPCYMYKDKPLIYFAAMKGHLGVYPTPGPINNLKEVLREYSTSKGCVRLKYTLPIPKKIILALISGRIKEIDSM